MNFVVSQVPARFWLSSFRCYALLCLLALLAAWPSFLQACHLIFHQASRGKPLFVFHTLRPAACAANVPEQADQLTRTLCTTDWNWCSLMLDLMREVVSVDWIVQFNEFCEFGSRSSVVAWTGQRGLSLSRSTWLPSTQTLDTIEQCRSPDVREAAATILCRLSADETIRYAVMLLFCTLVLFLF